VTRDDHDAVLSLKRSWMNIKIADINIDRGDPKRAA
jgi:hypothetical protein